MTRYFIITFLFITPLVSAQKGTLSPYSFYGLGEPLFEGTIDQRSMGCLVAHVDSIHFNISSPASLANLKLVNYAVGANHSSRKFSSEDNSTNNVTAGIDYMSLAIPTKYFGFGFGLIPKTAVGYRLSVDNQVDGVNTNSNYEGSGGINQVFFSFGFSPIKNAGIGLAIHYNFGTIFRSHTRQDEGIDLLSQLASESEIRGVELNLSSYYKIDLSDRLQMQVHYAYQPTADLESFNSRTISTFTSLGGSRDSQEINLSNDGLDQTISRLPSKQTFGGGIGEPKKWFVGGQWSSSEESIDNVFYSTGSFRYEPATKLSLGGYFIPEYDSFSSYWKRIVYRAGFVSSKTGMILNDKSIINTGITFGVGLPVAGFSNLNIGIEFGKLGADGETLIQENYFNTRIGFSLNDRWFIKRKYN
ncbi:MAG: hypothetical protein VXW60_03820 [Bacteroidota bacterium]|nr:hypothetical protein [Bacteroidota bacterium]